MSICKQQLRHENILLLHLNCFTGVFILQSVARGGVSVNVNLEYQIEGSGEGRLCPIGTPRAQACIAVSDGWRNNRINLEAWYISDTQHKVVLKKSMGQNICKSVLNPLKYILQASYTCVL